MLALRRPGQGFAGLARLDDGRLIAAMRSPLPNPDAASTAGSPLVRLVLFDALSGTTTTLAYELGGPGRSIGDLAQASGPRVLVLEHDAQGGGWVYAVDLSRGTLVQPHYGGRTMEQLGAAAAASPDTLGASGLQPVPKRLVLDLVASGWDPALGPAEGLVALSSRTLTVVNDNGYGLQQAADDGSFAVSGPSTVLYTFRLPVPIWYDGTARLPLRERDLDVREGNVREGDAADDGRGGESALPEAAAGGGEGGGS